MLIADSQQRILFDELQTHNNSEQYSEGVIVDYFKQVSIFFNIDIKQTLIHVNDSDFYWNEKGSNIGKPLHYRPNQPLKNIFFAFMLPLSGYYEIIRADN